ncbi:hypothetical protein ACFX19_005245 [Malus domestica]
MQSRQSPDLTEPRQRYRPYTFLSLCPEVELKKLVPEDLEESSERSLLTLSWKGPFWALLTSKELKWWM